MITSTGPAVQAKDAIRQHEWGIAIEKLKSRLDSKQCTNFISYGVDDGMLEFAYTDAEGITHYDDLDLDYKGEVEDQWGSFQL